MRVSRRERSQAAEAAESKTAGQSRNSGALAFRRFAKQDVGHEQDGSDDNRAVSDIERRPVIAADVEVEEVDHMSGDHAVPEITESAAKNHRERGACGVDDVAVFPEQHAHHAEREEREEDEQSEFPLE